MTRAARKLGRKSGWPVGKLAIFGPDTSCAVDSSVSVVRVVLPRVSGSVSASAIGCALSWLVRRATWAGAL